jgi:hypothetical protein
MSAVAYATPVHRPFERPFERPSDEELPTPQRVRIVTTRAQRRARPKLVYALGAVAVIFAIFLSQLLITIALSSGAYQITSLQSVQQNLGRTASALGEHLDTLGSSQNLAANARALGMVSSASAAFIRLSDGAVLGSAAPAAASGSFTGLVDSVPNSLLDSIPLASGNVAPSTATGSGHGVSNTANSTGGTTESTQGKTAPAQTGTTSPAAPTSSDSGELPSPVTH